MERIKKIVKEEVVAVQITKEEFVKIASEECKEMFLELSSTGEPSEMDILYPMACAEFAGHLAAKIFHTTDDENEEREEN